jgi:hypothetical protein
MQITNEPTMAWPIPEPSGLFSRWLADKNSKFSQVPPVAKIEIKSVTKMTIAILETSKQITANELLNSLRLESLRYSRGLFGSLAISHIPRGIAFE